MNFKINRKNFINALTVGGEMSGKSKILEILKCSKVTTKDKYLIVSSFDGEVSATKRVELEESSEDMEFCVNSNDLLRFLQTMSDESINVEIEENSMLVKHEKGKMEMPIEKIDTFPLLRNGENRVVNDVDAFVLFDFLKKARGYTETEMKRPIINGVYLYFEEGVFGVCGCDNPKIYTDFENSPQGVRFNKGDAVVVTKAISPILSMISSQDTVRIAIDDRNISFMIPNTRIQCRKIEGQFPKYKRVFPKDFNVVVKCNRDDLLDSVNRVRMTTENDKRLSLKIEGDKIGISASNLKKGKRSVEHVETKHSGEDIEMGVNGDILAHSLSCIESNEVTIKLNSPKSAFILIDEERPNKSILLMPLVI